jgi:hypothetical protein
MTQARVFTKYYFCVVFNGVLLDPELKHQVLQNAWTCLGGKPIRAE